MADPIHKTVKAESVPVEDTHVVLCVPFPDGKPACAQCGSPEITHVVVFRVVLGAETSTAVGCMCDECAKPLAATFEAGQN